jgi:hypothetical protein
LEHPKVDKEPAFAPAAIYKYENLPKRAEERAIQKREEWVTRAFGDVTTTLSNMAAPDVTALLRTLETDLSLVHAAYYTDDECIERIAEWISEKKPEKQAGTEFAELPQPRDAAK